MCVLCTVPPPLPLQEHIHQENARLEEEGTFWAKEIVVRIEYKYSPNLTLIDTPGALACSVNFLDIHQQLCGSVWVGMGDTALEMAPKTAPLHTCFSTAARPLSILHLSNIVTTWCHFGVTAFVCLTFSLLVLATRHATPPPVRRPHISSA